jgi:hypothetical protein
MFVGASHLLAGNSSGTVPFVEATDKRVFSRQKQSIVNGLLHPFASRRFAFGVKQAVFVRNRDSRKFLSMLRLHLTHDSRTHVAQQALCTAKRQMLRPLNIDFDDFWWPRAT